MAATILTPSLIWKDFQTPECVNFREEEGVTFNDNVRLTHVYIDGRRVKDGNVEIYGALVTPTGKCGGGTVLIVQDLSNDNDLTLAIQLATNGYETFVVDLAGYKDGKERYTVYPNGVEYANLEKSVYGKTELDCEVTATCWYEWSVAVAYAAAFLKSRNKSAKVGGFGIGCVAAALWQAAAVCDIFDCAVFAGNSGWYAYRGINKFGGEQEPRFSDGELAFVAGVEPQSYARQIKCPLLLLAPTNSPDFPCDRAYDTVARLEDGIYTAVKYSVGSRNAVDYESFATAEIFLDKFLRPTKNRADLPSEARISGEIKEGKLVVEVTPFAKDVKSVNLYVAEQMLNPRYRSWRKKHAVSEQDGKYIFEYEPYDKSASLVYFAETVYKNGFVISTIIEERSFAPNEAGTGRRHKIIYSSRRDGVESMFCVAVENTLSPYGVDILNEPKVQVKKGPMDFYGIGGMDGLMTFRIMADKFRPNDDALMMLDVYVKGGGVFTARLITDYYGENRTEYSASVEITSGEDWQNVKFEKNNFKTSEGMTLKNYSRIEAIEFYADGEFLINNALWV